VEDHELGKGGERTREAAAALRRHVSGALG